VSAFAVRRTIDINHRNTAMQIFLRETNFSFILLTIFCIPLTGANGDKRYVFLVNTCAFYSSVALNQRTLTPAIR